jgi:hypothetical protein
VLAGATTDQSGSLATSTVLSQNPETLLSTPTNSYTTPTYSTPTPGGYVNPWTGERSAVANYSGAIGPAPTSVGGASPPGNSFGWQVVSTFFVSAIVSAGAVAATTVVCAASTVVCAGALIVGGAIALDATSQTASTLIDPNAPMEAKALAAAAYVGGVAGGGSAGIGAARIDLPLGGTEVEPPYARSQYGLLTSTARSAALEKSPVCPYCGVADSTQVDHIVALRTDWSTGGWKDDYATRTARMNSSGNLIGACQACNASKQARPIGLGPAEWWPPAWPRGIWWPFGGP